MKKAIGLVVIILILPFIINIPDVRLRAEAEKIISSSPEAIKPQTNNGFYALLGFETPMGRDIYEAGKAVCAAYSNQTDQIGD